MDDSDRTARRIAVQTAGAPPAAELAGLVALERLCLGMVHTLNNAFTAIQGEATFLQSARKDDAELVEACQVIRGEVDRCARMARALLARRAPPPRTSEPVDLARLVRDLVGLLRDTLSRRLELDVALPDDAVLVAGESRAIESLVLLMAQQAAASTEGAGRLRLRVVSGGASGRQMVCADLEISDPSRETGTPWIAPAARAAAALPAQALHALAGELGAALEIERTPERFVLRALLLASRGR